MILARTENETVANLSAQYLATCLADHAGRIRLDEATGVPYEGLLIPCLILHEALEDMQTYY